MVTRLFELARNAKEPLKSYATGLLAAAMEVQDIAIEFKDQNVNLVPIMLKRLKDLRLVTSEGPSVKTNGNTSLSSDSESNKSNKRKNDGDENLGDKCDIQSFQSPTIKKRRLSSPNVLSECSNSSWVDIEPYMIGCFKMFPLTPEMQQRFIFQYLTPMGDYQELLVHIFANGALSLIKHYINLKENKDVRVAFEALKYLASLLCHKKFALEFLNSGGLEQLLQVYRPSVAATGVSICLYYLGYNEDAMEKVSG